MDVDSEMERVIKRLPKYAKDWLLVQKSNAQDIVFKNEPYYSKVRLEPTIVDGTTIVTYTFAAGLTATAFSYGQNGPMASAGFNATGTGFTQATLADTNLITSTGKVTNGGDMFVIDGIAIAPLPRTDSVLMKNVIAEISVQAGFNGQANDYKLGGPLQWPGAAGLFGAGRSLLQMPSLTDATGAFLGTVTNGLPGAADVRWLTDPIVWMPQNTGADGLFQIQLRVERTVAVVAAARTAAAGIVGVAPPVTAGAEGSFVDFLVTLYGNQFGPRSRNR